MFKSLKNLFSTPNKTDKVMTETQTEMEPIVDESLPDAITESPINETNPVQEPQVEVPPVEIPSYEELTSFNPRDVITSNETLLYAPEIVGWLSTAEQEILFEALLTFYNPAQSLLDVGCGRADLFAYCKNIYGQTIPYKGIDYNPNMLSIAAEKYDGVNTQAIDVLNTSSDEKFDWVMGSGLFNLLDNSDMITYAKTVVDKMYEKSNIGVVFNVLTGIPEDVADEDKAQLVIHDPAGWLEYLIATYGKVICRADYLSGDATFFILK